MTFGYSLISEVVVRQLRRWKKLWRRSLTRSHRRTSMGLSEVVGTVQVYCSQRKLLRRGLEFHVCTINKSVHTKKSLETYLMIPVYWILLSLGFPPWIIYIYIYIDDVRCVVNWFTWRSATWTSESWVVILFQLISYFIVTILENCSVFMCIKPVKIL